MGRSDAAKILVKGLVNPSDWSNPSPSYDLKYDLEKYFNTKVYPINSGRSAIYSILKALGIGEGDEVIIQAYTCNAVPNPILWTRATPIYADIEADTLNVNPTEVDKKITANTKAIIIQHTFGRPGPISEIKQIAKSHKLLLIEDCAHSLGAQFRGRKLGTLGDVSILSFGREKVISSLAGGAILVNNEKLEKPIADFLAKLDYPSFYTYLKEFNNYLTWRLLIRKVFFTNTGKNLLAYLNKHDFFNVVTSKKELVGERPSWYPRLLPGTLAKIATLELPKVDEVNKKRNEIANYYEKNLNNKQFQLLKPHDGIYLRFVLLHKNPNPVYEAAKQHKFWFGNWYNTPVYPSRVDLNKMKYDLGSYPVAEKASRETINLPNYIGMTESDAEEIVTFINSYED